MNTVKRTHIIISIIFSFFIVLFVGAGIFFLLWNNYTSERESIKQEQIEYVDQIESNISGITDFLLSGEELLWDNNFEVGEENKNSQEIVDSIFNDIFDLTERIQEKDIVHAVPINKQYEFQVLSKDFIYFSSNHEPIFTNMSDYQYENYENYVGVLEKTQFFEEGRFVGRIPLGEEIILYFIPLQYTHSEFISDVRLYALYLVGIFCVIFIMVYLFIGFLFQPLLKNYNAMDEFIHNAGHELKTPLAAILSSVGILKHTKKYDEDIISELISETKRSNDMIEVLRDISRVESSQKLEKFLVSQKVQEIKKIFDIQLRKSNIHCSIHIQEDFEILADENHFFICVSNILKNAIKYNTAGGKIQIILQRGRIQIIDTGIGMKASEIKRIFERFYRSKTHRDGTGLGVGLFLVQKIAKIYGWKIGVESEVGKGTSFEIKFI